VPEPEKTKRNGDPEVSNLRPNTPDTARRTIETESSYEGAERAVDWLSDQQFPVEHVSIIGTGLRYVEQVSGRVTTANAALRGAGQGAMLGLLFGLFFGLFFTGTAFFGVLVYGLIAGTFWGALWWAIVHYAQGGRRDFGSTSQTRADRYEVQVDDDLADEALRVLGQMPGRNGRTSAQAT
jgi:hypothetical protein